MVGPLLGASSLMSPPCCRPVLPGGPLCTRMQAGSCCSDKWKKNCLLNLANNGQGPQRPHRCPPASKWRKAHIARMLCLPKCFPHILGFSQPPAQMGRATSHVTGEETEAERQLHLSKVTPVSQGYPAGSYYFAHSGGCGFFLTTLIYLFICPSPLWHSPKNFQCLMH